MAHIWHRIITAMAIVAGTTASGGSIGAGSALAVHLRAPRIDAGGSR